MTMGIFSDTLNGLLANQYVSDEELIAWVQAYGVRCDQKVVNKWRKGHQPLAWPKIYPALSELFGVPPCVFVLGLELTAATNPAKLRHVRKYPSWPEALAAAMGDKWSSYTLAKEMTRLGLDTAPAKIRFWRKGMAPTNPEQVLPILAVATGVEVEGLIPGQSNEFLPM